MVEDISVVPKAILVPKREIVRLGNRWIIYLFTDMNELWEEIKNQGKKVKIYVEVVDS